MADACELTGVLKLDDYIVRGMFPPYRIDDVWVRDGGAHIDPWVGHAVVLTGAFVVEMIPIGAPATEVEVFVAKAVRAAG